MSPGANWTFLLPSLELDLILCVGLPPDRGADDAGAPGARGAGALRQRPAAARGERAGAPQRPGECTADRGQGACRAAAGRAERRSAGAGERCRPPRAADRAAAPAQVCGHGLLCGRRQVQMRRSTAWENRSASGSRRCAARCRRRCRRATSGRSTTSFATRSIASFGKARSVQARRSGDQQAPGQPGPPPKRAGGPARDGAGRAPAALPAHHRRAGWRQYRRVPLGAGRAWRVYVRARCYSSCSRVASNTPISIIKMTRDQALNRRLENEHRALTHAPGARPERRRGAAQGRVLWPTTAAWRSSARRSWRACRSASAPMGRPTAATCTPPSIG